jgi:adenylate cyclase
MKKPGFIISALVLLNLAVYLLYTAPPPLAEVRQDSAQVSIQAALAILNEENARVRTIYTRDIVGAGLKAGLRFDERWQREDVQAGPLPALFLRETARRLERRPVQLGLFLGSKYPVRAANQFSGEQAEHFAAVEATGAPAFFRSKDTDRATAMFADRAVAEACVTCHNDHPNSPKHDWAMNDVMGATTWTHPAESVSLAELLALIEALRGSVAEAYGAYLDKARGFDAPPAIGAEWPADAYALPTTEVFMARVRANTGEATLQALLTTLEGSRAEEGAAAKVLQ